MRRLSNAIAVVFEQQPTLAVLVSEDTWVNCAAKISLNSKMGGHSQSALTG